MDDRTRLVNWGRHWILIGDMVACTAYMAHQTIEHAHTPFQHLTNCGRNPDCAFPWEEIGELVGVLLDE
jgi:hypothetical protein